MGLNEVYDAHVLASGLATTQCYLSQGTHQGNWFHFSVDMKNGDKQTQKNLVGYTGRTIAGSRRAASLLGGELDAWR